MTLVRLAASVLPPAQLERNRRLGERADASGQTVWAAGPRLSADGGAGALPVGDVEVAVDGRLVVEQVLLAHHVEHGLHAARADLALAREHAAFRDVAAIRLLHLGGGQAGRLGED